MDDRSALMGAIIANPGEDTPRLALADWLQEHGDKHERAHAEFIRAQIEANAVGKGASAARTRAAALRKAHVKHWLGPLWSLARWPDNRAFKRGILEWWYMTAGDFLKNAGQAAVCDRFPALGVERLMLAENTKRVAALAASPALAWVANLIWRDAKIGDDGFTALAKSPFLYRLSRLDIDKPRCSDAGLKALAKSDGLPNLRALALWDGVWGGRFTAAGVKQVLESDRFPRLDELRLTGAHDYAVTGRALFNCKSLSRLRILYTGFGTDLKALARCPHLSNLTELRVSNTYLTDATARELADSPALAQIKILALTELNTYKPPLGPEAEKALRDRFGERLLLHYSILARRT